jgi:nucleoside-diphosphate-sugar epimerase
VLDNISGKEGEVYMRIAITGGSGFVGAAFARRLYADGHVITIIDNLVSEGSGERFARLPPVTRFVTDVREFVKRIPCDFDLVVHCAAVVGGRLHIDGDPISVGADLAIDADVFQWAVKAETKPQVIYFSSSAVYPTELQGSKHHIALAESLVFQGTSRLGRPDAVYGWAKLTGEMLADYAVRQYGLDVKIFRPFSGYGEDQSFDYPFPSIIRRVVNRENPITIWGSGDQCRDFIHIDDIVEAVMQTKDVLKPGEVLNLGTGVATSFKDLADIARIRVHGDMAQAFIFDTTKPEGVFYRVADTYKLGQFYKPKISLEEGIRRVAAHLTKAKEGV